jgi:hypothetical protein
LGTGCARSSVDANVNVRAYLATFVMLLALALPAYAHVGSPDVFYEGDAGPYHLFVTVRLPQVIPGVAVVEVRSNSPDVREIATAVTRLTPSTCQFRTSPSSRPPTLDSSPPACG